MWKRFAQEDDHRAELRVDRGYDLIVVLAEEEQLATIAGLLGFIKVINSR